MKALVFRGKERIGVEERPVPQLSDEEVLIRVKHAGICGTDLSIYAGLHPRAKPGLVMGHEFSGVIEDLDSETRKDELAVGDRVTVEPLISCGRCFACRSGFAYVCQYLGLYGIDSDGAFAEFVKIAADKVFKVPETISDKVAALIEPVAVAVHSVRLSSVQVADSVCVLGGGPIGLLTALVVRELGPRNLFLCEQQSYRINLAREFGLNVIDITEADPVEEVMRTTDGRGVDVVFEVAGAEQAILISPQLCRVRGEIIQVAMPKVPRPVDIVGFTFKELTMKGVRVYAPYDFERAIQIIASGKDDLQKLLSEPFVLEDAQDAFALAKRGEGVMKVLFRIS